MSNATAIVLTLEDVNDLWSGYTINAMDEAGDEHTISGTYDLDGEQINALKRGEPVSFGDHPLSIDF